MNRRSGSADSASGSRRRTETKPLNLETITQCFITFALKNMSRYGLEKSLIIAAQFGTFHAGVMSL
jgi:hypothetical protein